MKIVICGSGHVGLMTGQTLLGLKHNVYFYDISSKRSHELHKQGYLATSLWSQNLSTVDIVFISVPTPAKRNGDINVSYLRNAVEFIALNVDSTYPIIVIRSTVLPSHLKSLQDLFEKESGCKIGHTAGFAVMPEFATQISNSWSDDKRYAQHSNQNFIIIGTYDEKSHDILTNLYQPLNLPIFRTTPEQAMFLKYANNLCLASRVSFWNQMFLIGEKLGFNTQKVADILSNDTRIGKYGTKLGAAYGGSCLPKDVKAFIRYAKKVHHSSLLQSVDKINEEMKWEYGARE